MDLLLSLWSAVGWAALPLLMLGSFLLGLGTASWRYHRRRPEPELVATRVPRFGQPKVEIYRPSDFEEPLVCNGECGELGLRRALVSGELFWLIPVDDEARFLPWCLDCIPMPKHMVNDVMGVTP